MLRDGVCPSKNNRLAYLLSLERLNFVNMFAVEHPNRQLNYFQIKRASVKFTRPYTVQTRDEHERYDMRSSNLQDILPQ